MSNFPPTRWSLISAVRSVDETAANDALEELCRIYRPAILAFARQALSNEQDAEDITQEFFISLLQRSRVGKANPEFGKFRTFLLTDFKFVLLDYLKRERAAKRGNRQMHVSTDELLDSDVPVSLPDNAIFDVAWATAILRETLRLLEAEETRKQGSIPFDDLKGFLPGFQAVGPVSYENLEQRHGVTSGALRVRVNRLRDRFKELLNSVLADTVGSAAELESEREVLLGALLRAQG